HQPEVIALQEATLAMLRPLLEQDWVRRQYYTTASPHSPTATHGVVLLCRFPTPAYLLQLPGHFGRRSAILELAGLRVASVHLESLNSAHVRREQLRLLFTQLQDSPSAMLLGDFNFCSSWEENRQLPADYLDLWPAVHPDLPGYTEDTQLNTM